MRLGAGGGEPHPQAPPAAETRAVPDLRDRDEVAAGDVQQDRHAQRRAGDGRHEAGGGGPDGVQHVERGAAVLGGDRHECAEAARRAAGIVDRRPEERPAARPALLPVRVDVQLVTGGGHPFDQPEQARDDAVRAAAVHAARHQHADLHAARRSSVR